MAGQLFGFRRPPGKADGLVAILEGANRSQNTELCGLALSSSSKCQGEGHLTSASRGSGSQVQAGGRRSGFRYENLGFQPHRQTTEAAQTLVELKVQLCRDYPPALGFYCRLSGTQYHVLGSVVQSVYQGNHRYTQKSVLFLLFKFLFLLFSCKKFFSLCFLIFLIF